MSVVKTSIIPVAIAIFTIVSYLIVKRINTASSFGVNLHVFKSEKHKEFTSIYGYFCLIILLIAAIYTMYKVIFVFKVIDII